MNHLKTILEDYGGWNTSYEIPRGEDNGGWDHRRVATGRTDNSVGLGKKFTSFWNK